MPVLRQADNKGYEIKYYPEQYGAEYAEAERHSEDGEYTRHGDVLDAQLGGYEGDYRQGNPQVETGYEYADIDIDTQSGETEPYRGNGGSYVSQNQRYQDYSRFFPFAQYGNALVQRVGKPLHRLCDVPVEEPPPEVAHRGQDRDAQPPVDVDHAHQYYSDAYHRRQNDNRGHASRRKMAGGGDESHAERDEREQQQVADVNQQQAAA